MTRTIILAVLTVTLALVSVEAASRENELVKYPQISGRINMPDVKIEQWQIPQFFVDYENVWRKTKCCVTTTFTNVEDLELTEDSDEMKQINEIVKEINEISSKFEVAQNSGTYNDMKSDMDVLQDLAAKLKVIDENLPYERSDKHEGSLILGICVDIHSLLTYIYATITRKP